MLIVAFAIPAWAARVDAFPRENEATVVRVVAEQFAWNAHYPGADGQFGRTDIKLVAADNPLGLDRSDPAAKDDFNSVNQLALPVNKPAILHLSSKDVIHSFSLIQMRVKQDTIPGESIPVWFTPTMTGDWEVNCSQLCGLGPLPHARVLLDQDAGSLRRVAQGNRRVGAGGAIEAKTRINTIDAQVARGARAPYCRRRPLRAGRQHGGKTGVASQTRRETAAAS